jgi:DNA-binding MarR family transcriptional regulator
MSLTSAATLATLDKTGPRRITDLAVTEGVTQPAMTVLVRVMEESGLVERTGDPYARLIDELTGDEVGALAAALPALLHLAELESHAREESHR